MTDDEERAIAAAMREAIAKARGYADYFGWAPNRDLEEWGVLQGLRESLELQGRQFYYRNLVMRGRPNDPPDGEAHDADGHRIAVEVTELVNPEAIRAFKSGRKFDFAFWDRSIFLSSLANAVLRKDAKFPQLKDPPYDGGHDLVIFTDEPMLSRAAVDEFLSGHRIEPPKYLSRVVLLLGYDPGVERCPVYEIYERA
jgi:hypothetical protein